MSQNENMAKMKVKLRKLQIRMIRLWRELPLRRYLGHLFLLSLMGLGAWAAQAGFSSTPARTEVAASTAETTPSALDNPDTEIKVLDLLPFSGIPYTVSQVERIAEVHTIFPSRPRLSVITYGSRRVIPYLVLRTNLDSSPRQYYGEILKFWKIIPIQLIQRIF